MSRIAFFSIPAYGHTNPTLALVKELTRRGHEVRYYSVEPFREAIERAGASFISCDSCLNGIEQSAQEAAKNVQDVGASVHILCETTLALDEMVQKTLQAWQPDCIVADSMAVWGKFAAKKLGIPYVCSNTTFAFNRYAARIMKSDFSQLFKMLLEMPRINQDLARLRAQGYAVKNVMSILNSDDECNTIVYTSREFQPCAETFSPHFVFVGPSIRDAQGQEEKRAPVQVYISLGTVNNLMLPFYKSCIEAFRDSDYSVVMSVGKACSMEELGEIPDNFTVQDSVDQIAVLQNTDVFLSHCGMNSVNESLYYGVPLVLYPQTAEQGGVATRVEQLEAGLMLKNADAASIRKAVDTVLANEHFRKCAAHISEGFRAAGGAVAAADAILGWIAE